jgi:hypothetical protein
MTDSLSIDAMAAKPKSGLSPRPVVALVVSVLMHAAIFVGDKIDLSPAPELKPLEIRMVRTAPDLKVANAPPPPQATKAKPRQTQPMEVAQQDLAPPSLPDPPAQELPEAVAAVDEPQDKPEAAPSDTPPDVTQFSGTAWPRAGRIGYALLMGEQRLPAGKTTHQWQVTDDGKYRLEALTEPMNVALIPWFKPGRTLWVSVGRVTPQGLQPDAFVEKKEGRPGENRVDLDRAANQVSLAGTTAPLLENTQDALSVFYQLGYPGAAAPGEMSVTDGSKIDAYRFEVLGEEQLDMPFGQTLRTMRVRARYGTGREQTDVWIAIERFGLPVQIRKIDPKGVVYYWVANEIRVAVNSAAPAPPSAPRDPT